MPKSAPKRITRIQRITREAILQSATEVFANHGFRGATLEQVADHAGMSKTNLLYYYPNKAELYNATIDATLDVWLGSLERLDPNGDAHSELRRYIAEKIQFSLDNPLASRLFASEVLHGAQRAQDVLSDRLKDLMDDKTKAIRKWIKSGQLAKVDPYNLIFIIFAATQTFADFAAQINIVTGKSLSDKKYFDQVSADLEQILLRGVVNQAVDE